ncbi:2-(3-amino-3-carboxypropyl)histidine synthase subunit 1 [Colletotrichum liriopes]|uniref:2-(3-amino-3-carboxypropyl)histidine synthase subunit 1 n=1 Tax=Colletotrichum liriopes TaxID=708192 RepID=A0AA37GZ31_9PEZI|nr:2-(3-amino-3-carboxypropyl)histidine synthase subunit 1 [Colletotrichum liriopes]
MVHRVLQSWALPDLGLSVDDEASAYPRTQWGHQGGARLMERSGARKLLRGARDQASTSLSTIRFNAIIHSVRVTLEKAGACILASDCALEQGKILGYMGPQLEDDDEAKMTPYLCDDRFYLESIIIPNPTAPHARPRCPSVFRLSYTASGLRPRSYPPAEHHVSSGNWVWFDRG